MGGAWAEHNSYLSRSLSYRTRSGSNVVGCCAFSASCQTWRVAYEIPTSCYIYEIPTSCYDFEGDFSRVPTTSHEFTTTFLRVSAGSHDLYRRDIV